MLTPDLDFLVDASSVRSMPLGSFMGDIYDLAVQMGQVKLSDAEVALLNAVQIVSTERGRTAQDLLDRNSVDELHATLLHVL